MNDQETYRCHDCGHTETAPIGEVAGRSIKKTVGPTGRRSKVIETVICPECYSENWLGEHTADMLGVVEDAV